MDVNLYLNDKPIECSIVNNNGIVVASAYRSSDTNFLPEQDSVEYFLSIQYYSHIISLVSLLVRISAC